VSRKRSKRRVGKLVGWLAVAVAIVALGFWLAGRAHPRLGQGTSKTQAPAKKTGGRVPAPRESAVATVHPREGKETAARVAIVIDDLGRSLREIDRLEALGVPLTYAVLPWETHTADVVARLRAHGAEILCHLPMEAQGGADPGKGAIEDDLSPRRIERRTREALEKVPGAVGVNNHMGSRITADRKAMGEILDVVAERGLFFLDSRTTPESVAYEIARSRAIPAAQRDVFLDAERTPEAVRAELGRLFALAREKGAAIAIGHPHEVTLAALEEEIPKAKAAGIEFVPVSYLLDRSEDLPQ
jgi:polysaccharide deacetylase 2 family uncharacterized protein YibQ